MANVHVGFAYTRSQLKDKLEEFLDGALYQHYLLTLLAQTTETYLRDHWVDKKRSRLRSMVSALTHSATIKPAAKLLVFREVQQMLQGRRDAKTQADAVDHFGAIYAKRVDMTALVITAADTDVFWVEAYDRAVVALAD